MIRQIYDTKEKQAVARVILEALPQWFGIPEARENYISESGSQVTFGAFEWAGESCQTPVGFLCLKETGKDTMEISVMGVRKEYHRTGIGTKLFTQARSFAASMGYSFLQVKTVQMGRYPEYDATNAFYLSLGFREFEVFPTLWDEWNPCQIYVMGVTDSAAPCSGKSPAAGNLKGAAHM